MVEDAKTPIFLNHRAALGAVARKYLLNREDVEDALQELFIRSWENRRPDTTPEQKRAFLFTSLRNICIDLLRKRRTSPQPLDDATVRDIPSPRPDRVEQADIAAAVRREAARRLPPQALRVFELYTFDELDYEEIASRLGISTEAARSQMCRARKVMREQCKEILKS